MSVIQTDNVSSRPIEDESESDDESLSGTNAKQQLRDEELFYKDTTQPFGPVTGGLEQETIQVFPWRKTKHILQSMGVVKAPHSHHQSAKQSTVIPSSKTASVTARRSSIDKGTQKPRKAQSKILPTLSNPSSIIEARGHGSEEDLEADKAENKNDKHGHVLPISIPHGFQLVKTTMHVKPTIKKVIYVSSTNNDCYAIQDPKRATILRGSVRETFSLTSEDSPLAGLCCWIYLKKWRVTVIATMNMSIKLLGLSMEVISEVNCSKPILSLEFNDTNDELIVGGAGIIKIWSFARHVEMGIPVYKFANPRLTIDLQIDEWISHSLYDKHNNRLYAASDGDLLVYDYSTGKRIQALRNIHELSISCMCFYDPLQYIITGSRDSSVKVWTRFNFLILDLRNESMSPITGVLVPNANEKSVLQPLIIVSSEDGNIRMWNLENGQCNYCLRTNRESLGIEWVRKDVFLNYSKDRICTWNLNRYYTAFSHLSSEVTRLSRIQVQGLPARILVACDDGSVRLLSPVTGVSLLTSFPAIKDAGLCSLEYDIITGRLWVLYESSDIFVYNCKCNPCKIAEEWKYNALRAKLKCMTSIKLLPIMNTFLPDQDSVEELTVPVVAAPRKIGPVFGLIGGSDTGQIVFMDIRYPGGREYPLAQAHAAEVTHIICNDINMQIVTCGRDQLIKVWKFDFTETAFVLNSGNTVGLIALAPIAITPISHSPTSFIIPVNSQPVSTCLNNGCSTLVVALSTSQILFYNCYEGGVKGIKRIHPADEDHTKVITCISALESIGLFASSSLDGTVKIWDGKAGNLVRDIQFNEPITSVCFCNSYGDLLVGMTTQIALVHVQDYLTFPFLSELLSHPDVWSDDIIETPASFDSTLDFWELYRKRLESEGVDLTNWHVHFTSKSFIDDKMTRMIEELEQRQREAEERRYKLSLLEREAKKKKKMDLYTLQQDEHYDYFDFDHGRLSLSLRGKDDISNSDSEEEEEAKDDEDYDIKDVVEEPQYDKLRQLSSGKVEFSMERKQSTVQISDGPIKPKDEYRNSFLNRRKSIMQNPRRDSMKSEKSGQRKYSLVPGTRGLKRGSVGEVSLPKPATHTSKDEPKSTPNTLPTLPTSKAARQALVAAPPKFVQKKKIKSRGSIQETMINFGILPNSVVGAEVSEIRRERAESERRERELEEAKNDHHSIFSLNEEKVEFKSLELPKHLRSRRAKPVEVPVVIMDLSELVDLNDEDEKPQVPEVVEEKVPETVPVVTIQVQKTVEPTPIIVGDTKEPEPEPPGETEAERLERERLEALRLAEQAELERQLKFKEEEGRRRMAEEMRRKAALRKKRAAETVLLKDDEKLMQIPIAGEVSMKPILVIPSPEPLRAPSVTQEFSKQPSEHLDTRRTETPYSAVESRMDEVESFVETRVDSGSATPESSSETSSAEKPDGDSFIVSQVSKEPSTVEARKVWGLFEVLARSESRIRGVPDEFSRVMAYPWFPGLQGKELNVWNIIEVLFRVMKTGLWREKCEASKALLYLFKVFEPDIGDPLGKVILPQLEFVCDQDWQMRAQMCTNLAGYNKFHPEVILAIMTRLQDSHPYVRKAAMESLAEFGITSKEYLRYAMMEFNLIPKHYFVTRCDWLDYLISRIVAMEQARLVEVQNAVDEWRIRIHPRIYGLPMPRPASGTQTLCMPETKHTASKHMPRDNRFLCDQHGRMMLRGVSGGSRMDLNSPGRSNSRYLSATSLRSQSQHERSVSQYDRALSQHDQSGASLFVSSGPNERQHSVGRHLMPGPQNPHAISGTLTSEKGGYTKSRETVHFSEPQVQIVVPPAHSRQAIPHLNVPKTNSSLKLSDSFNNIDSRMSRLNKSQQSLSPNTASNNNLQRHKSDNIRPNTQQGALNTGLLTKSSQFLNRQGSRPPTRWAGTPGDFRRVIMSRSKSDAGHRISMLFGSSTNRLSTSSPNSNSYSYLKSYPKLTLDTLPQVMFAPSAEPNTKPHTSHSRHQLHSNPTALLDTHGASFQEPTLILPTFRPLSRIEGWNT